MPSDRQTPDDQKQRLKAIADKAQAGFAQTHDARERALRLSRQAIRDSANSIRATHRGEFQQARELLNTVAKPRPGVRAQFWTPTPTSITRDSSRTPRRSTWRPTPTLAFAQGAPLPGPDELGVGPAPYMNGLAEAVGELRRFILDSLRRDDLSRCEKLLDTMDEVYAILTSMDFPEARHQGPATQHRHGPRRPGAHPRRPDRGPSPAPPRAEAGCLPGHAVRTRRRRRPRTLNAIFCPLVVPALGSSGSLSSHGRTDTSSGHRELTSDFSPGSLNLPLPRLHPRLDSLTTLWYVSAVKGHC